MNRRTPDDLPPELLAAYADGELGPHARDRVERWLAEHPEAREIIETQESIGPGNAELWDMASPPEPGARRWSEVGDGIRAGTRVSPVQRGLSWAGPAALMATAAALIMALPTDDRPQPQLLPAVPAAASTVQDEPYAMATDADVQIVSLPEAAAHLLVVGEHPLGNGLVVLARSDEVEFLGIGSDREGRFPEAPIETAPDDSPMIWAPRNP
jgi:anti-sigma factor RsiW